MELSALHSIVEKLDKKVDNEVLVLREGIADLKRGQQAPLKAAALVSQSEAERDPPSLRQAAAGDWPISVSCLGASSASVSQSRLVI